MKKHSKEFLELLNSVTAKRPHTVIQHILKNGFITSEELKDIYGYNHHLERLEMLENMVFRLPLIELMILMVEASLPTNLVTRKI